MPAEPDPISTDLTRARATRSIPPDAVCVICGERNREALKKVKASLIERHHLGGRANDPNLTVYLCRTHHHLQSLRQVGVGMELEEDDPDRGTLEKVVSVLRGLALFFDQLALALTGWANRLVDLIEALDADLPGWRNLGPV